MVGLALWFFKISKAFELGCVPLRIKVSMTTVPVDILLNEDGIIEKVYYRSNTTEHLKFFEIKNFH